MKRNSITSLKLFVAVMITSTSLSALLPSIAYGAINTSTSTGLDRAYDMNNINDINELPTSKIIQEKFTTMTDSDPLSIVTVTVNNGSRDFKKYQDIAYMLKNDWFTAGLFGLKFEYIVSDNNEAQLQYENTLPCYIRNIVVNAVDMTTGENIMFAQNDYDSKIYAYQNEKGLTTAAFGIIDPISAMADDVFVTSVMFDCKNEAVSYHAYYDFDNETLTSYSDDNLTNLTIKLTYDVLKNK